VGAGAGATPTFGSENSRMRRSSEPPTMATHAAKGLQLFQ